jgi:hypothetical protein
MGSNPREFDVVKISDMRRLGFSAYQIGSDGDRYLTFAEMGDNWGVPMGMGLVNICNHHGYTEKDFMRSFCPVEYTRSSQNSICGRVNMSVPSNLYYFVFSTRKFDTGGKVGLGTSRSGLSGYMFQKESNGQLDVRYSNKLRVFSMGPNDNQVNATMTYPGTVYVYGITDQDYTSPDNNYFKQWRPIFQYVGTAQIR